MMLRHCVALALMLAGAPANAQHAFAYHFAASSEGTYHVHSEGRVLVDGSRWRIEYEPGSDETVVHNAVIRDVNGDVIAINDSNHTWYRLPIERLAADSPLFTYDQTRTAAKITVVAPVKTRVAFSYRIDFKIMSETVHGKVSGEIRVTTSDVADAHAMPWSPADIHTGIDAVDVALRSALAQIQGAPRECEIEVARSLDDGPAMRQVIHRSVSASTPATSKPSDFSVPAGYKYQEPVVGAPPPSK